MDENGLLHLEIHKLGQAEEYEFFFPATNQIENEKRKFSTGMIQTIHQVDSTQYAPGCFRHGKFTVRAKLPHPVGDMNGMQAAYWFWPGEFDIFEMYMLDDHELQMNFHQWDFGNSHPTYPIDFPFNFDIFHTFTFEWTPYKFIYSIDGIKHYTFYRFYEININNNIPLISYLECEDIPDALSEPDATIVWEHYAWGGLDWGGYYTDLLLSTSVHSKELKDGDNSFGEMIVDWVKIEQKVSGLDLPEDYVLCGEGNQLFTLDNPLPSWTNPEWETSDNLIILIADNTAIEIQSEGIAGDAWINLTYSYWPTNRCFDHQIRQNIKLSPNLPQPSPPNDVIAWFQNGNSCCYNVIVPYSVPNATAYNWQITHINGGGGTEIFSTSSPITPCYNDDYLLVSVTAVNDCGTSEPYFEYFIGPSADEYGLYCNKSLYINPNPATDDITLLLKDSEQIAYPLPKGEVTILNQIGNVMYEEDFNNAGYPTINISQWESGVYNVIFKANLEAQVSNENILISEIPTLNSIFVKEN